MKDCIAQELIDELNGLDKEEAEQQEEVAKHATGIAYAGETTLLSFQVFLSCTAVQPESIR